MEIPLEVKKYFDEIGLPVELIKGLHDIFEMGASKHGRDSWLDKDNPSLQDLANLSSIARHNAQGHFGEIIDNESSKLHFWHIAARSIMKAVRVERGIDKGMYLRYNMLKEEKRHE